MIVAVLDGLRPDAISGSTLTCLRHLLEVGAHTLDGRTVEPSLTAPALASMLTGVPPSVHGIRSERGLLSRGAASLLPLPRVLRQHGYPVFGRMRALPLGFASIGSIVASRLGITTTFAGKDATEILGHAATILECERRGAIFFHWPDADEAGHAHGWMSPAYQEAVARLDAALARLVQGTGVLDDPTSVLIALADHGGGGGSSHDHDTDHPLDTTIPIVVAGGHVRPGSLRPGTSLLDVCATIPWALGISPPAAWQGRPLREAFHRPEPRPALGHAA